MLNLDIKDYEKYIKLGGNKDLNFLSNKYYDTLILYPELKIFSDNIEIIKDELKKFKGYWRNWTEITKSKEKLDWEVIPIFGFNKFTKVSNEFPKLKELIKNNNYIELLSFSKLGKNTVLKPHQGWKSTANISIRSHLGIDVPKNCGLWVEGEKYEIKNNSWISFDDSKFHTAYNISEEDRIILMFDIKKPIFIKQGTSTVNEPEGMLKYIIES